MSLQAHNYDTARVQGEIAAFLQTVQKYEQSPEQFDAEECRKAFEKLRNIIVLCTSLSEAKLVDVAFLIAFDGTDPASSDLRYVSTHLLILLHNFFANRDRDANQTYAWAQHVKSATEKPLGDYELLRQMVLPRLCKPGAIGGHHALALFFLEQVAEFENAQGSPVMRNEQAAELLGMGGAEIAYQLIRRYCDSKGINLIEQPGSLEQQYRKDKSFKLIEQKHGGEVPLLPYLIELYEYKKSDPWWVRMRRAVSSGFRGIAMRLAGPYVEYELTRRNGAFVVQIGAIFTYFVVLALALYGLDFFQERRLKDVDNDTLFVINDLIDREASQLGTEARDRIEEIEFELEMIEEEQ